MGKVKTGKVNMRHLLNKREKGVARALDLKYTERFNARPKEDKDLIYHLGDSAKRMCWSAVSGKLPTLRMAGGILWVVRQNRILTAREKLASLGFPVTPDVANVMGVPELPLADVRRAAEVAGNAMHWGTVGVVQMVALSCFHSVV